jgi:hypothetical protein
MVIVPVPGDAFNARHTEICLDDTESAPGASSIIVKVNPAPDTLLGNS